VQSRSLVLSGAGTASIVHFVLVCDAVSPPAGTLAAAKAELSTWVAAAFPS
jgi:hypothetical protein